MEALFHVAGGAERTRELHEARNTPDTPAPVRMPAPVHARDVQATFAYRAGLATCELIAEVLRLLGIERGAERLVCRYLADLADRIERRRGLALTAGSDELRAACCCFGLG